MRRKYGYNPRLFDELKKYRTALGLSQESFVNRAGLHRTYNS
jgi:transcriptional regulator with XRE-family HTH domain